MEEIFKWGAYVITAIIGWFVKTLWNAQAAMREDMKQLEVNLPKEYVSKEDFRDMYQAVLAKLDRIEAYLLHNKEE